MEYTGAAHFRKLVVLLDDCEDPDKFLDILNSINPSIMFKMEVSVKELSLLDILIEIYGDKKWIDLYFKPTDSLMFPSLISHASFMTFLEVAL